MIKINPFILFQGKEKTKTTKITQDLWPEFYYYKGKSIKHKKDKIKLTKNNYVDE